MSTLAQILGLEPTTEVFDRTEWEESPECRCCTQVMCLNDGCEWSDDDRQLLCTDCSYKAMDLLLPAAQDTVRLSWIASHLTKFRIGLGDISVSWIDDKGFPQEKTVVLPEDFRPPNTSDVDILRYAIDLLSKS